MLEEKIKGNRELFDEAEPSEGHLSRFQAKLDAIQRQNSRKTFRFPVKFLRVAAVIIVLFGLSITFFLMNPSRNSGHLAANALPQEVQEARMYYEKMTAEKMQKINNCAASTSEASYIWKVVNDEINLLDSSSLELEQQLQSDLDNQRIINALIRNYKTKTDLLDNILNRICHI